MKDDKNLMAERNAIIGNLMSDGIVVLTFDHKDFLHGGQVTTIEMYTGSTMVKKKLVSSTVEVTEEEHEKKVLLELKEIAGIL